MEAVSTVGKNKQGKGSKECGVWAAILYRKYLTLEKPLESDLKTGKYTRNGKKRGRGGSCGEPSRQRALTLG